MFQSIIVIFPFFFYHFYDWNISQFAYLVSNVPYNRLVIDFYNKNKFSQTSDISSVDISD